MFVYPSADVQFTRLSCFIGRGRPVL